MNVPDERYLQVFGSEMGKVLLVYPFTLPVKDIYALDIP